MAHANMGIFDANLKESSLRIFQLIQGGPLPFTNGVITPIIIYKWPYKWVTGVTTSISGDI